MYFVGMEFVGPSKRVWAGIISNIFFTSGYAFLTGVAFFIRDWHTLELVMAAPVGIFLIYWWYVFNERDMIWTGFSYIRACNHHVDKDLRDAIS